MDSHSIDFSRYQIAWPVGNYARIPLNLFYKEIVGDRFSDIMSSKIKLQKDTALDRSLISLPKHLEETFCYIFALCEHLGYCESTKYKAISLVKDLLAKGKKKHLQLYAIVCLGISSKLYEKNHVNIIDMSSFTNQSFNRRQLLETELEGLSSVNQVYGIFNFELNPLDWRTNPNELLMIMLELSKELLPATSLTLIRKTAQVFMFCVLAKSQVLEDVGNDLLFIVAVLHSTLILLTHFSGQFPMTWRLSTLTKIEEARIMIWADKSIKAVIPSRVLELISFD